MSDTRDEQPVVGLPKLSEALCWLHVRTRAREEVRRVAPESDASRLAGQALCMGPSGSVLCDMANRAAAAEKADAPLAPRTAFGAAHGWPSLPWSAQKPKRRGWWWVELYDGKRQPVWVEKRKHAFDYSVNYLDSWFWCDDSMFRRWAGPLVEPEGASDAQTTANDQALRPLGED